MRSDSPRNSAQRGVLHRLLGQISTKTARALERLALSATDRLAAYKMRDVPFQGVQTLETRTLLSADFALDDVNEINELADSTAINQVFGIVAGAPDFQVNSESQGYQSRVVTASLNTGNVVAIWYSDSINQDGDVGGVYGQLFTADGTAIGNEFQVNTTTAGDQWLPEVASLNDGGFVVAWENLGSTSSFIGAQRFDSTGSMVGGEFQVNTTAENVSDVSVLGLSTGGYLITWVGDASGSSTVRGQTYHADGTTRGVELMVASVSGSDRLSLPVMTELGTGDVLFAYGFIPSGDSSQSELKGKVFETGDGAFGTEFLISQHAGSGERDVKLLASGTNNAFAIWDRTDGVTFESEVFMVNIDTTVDYNSESSLIPVQVTPNDGVTYYNPRIARLTGGNLILAFESRNNGTGERDVFGQLADSNGNLIGSMFRLNTHTPERQSGPVLAPTTDGGFLAFWRSRDQDGDGYGIFGNRFSADGSKGGANALFLNDTQPQGAPLFIYDVNGQAAPVLEPTGDTFMTVAGQYGTAEFNTFNGEYTYTLDDTNSSVDALNDGETLIETFVVRVGDIEISDYSNLDITINGATDQSAFISIDDTATITELANSTAPNIVYGAAALGEFKVNQFDSNYQGRIGSTRLSDGSAVVIWTSDGQDGSESGIFAQLFTSAGTPIGTEFQVNSDATFDQEKAAVAAMSDGGFVVVWAESDFDSVTYQSTWHAIEARRFDSHGNAMTGDITIAAASSVSKYIPDVVGLSDGGFVATWHESDSGNETIYAQRFSSTNTPSGSSYTITSASGDYSIYYPKVTELNNGNLLHLWNMRYTDPVTYQGDELLYAEIRDANGTVVSSATTVSFGTDIGQFRPEILPLSGGGFLVTWAQYESGNPDTAYVRGFDNNLSATTAAIQINPSDGLYYDYPHAAELDNGEIVITLTSDDPVNDDESWVQRFDASMNKIGGLIQVNTPASGNQRDPEPIALGSGDFLAVWRGNDPVTSYDIYAQKFDAQGNKVTTGTDLFSNDTNNDVLPLSVASVDGNLPISNQITAIGLYGTAVFNTLTGEYTYTLDDTNATVEALKDGDSLQEVFNVTVTNGNFNNVSLLTITINGATDAPPQPIDDIAIYTEKVNEGGTGGTSGNIYDNDPSIYQGGNSIIADVNGTAMTGSLLYFDLGYGYFVIQNNGVYDFAAYNDDTIVDDLNDGDMIEETFVITYSDPHQVSSTFTTRLVGATDAPPTDDAVSVDERDNHDGISGANGNIFDNDHPEYQGGNTVISAVNGQALELGRVIINFEHGLFVLFSDGEYDYRVFNDNPTIDSLDDGQTLVDTFTIEYSDPRVTSSIFTATVQGVTDTTPPSDDVNSITELANDGLIDYVSGNIFDNDHPEYQGGNSVIADVNGVVADQYGDIFVDLGNGRTLYMQSNGTYYYDIDNSHDSVDGLDDGESLIDVFTINYSSPYVTSSTLSVTVNGATDVPPADDDVSVDEVANDPFGISTYSGNIFANDASDYQSGATISDVSGETPDSYGYVFVSSAYGFLQLNVSTGDFSYDLDNSAAAVDALNNGETLLDSFTVNFTNPRVTSSDINVTINGATDVPPADDNVSVDEVANDPFGISTYSGNIFTNDASDYQSGATISDVSGETPDSYGYVFVSSVYGFLQLNVSTGDFSYDLDNSAAAVDALNNGETLLDSFTVNFTNPRVTSSDINVTINGATDVPPADDNVSVDEVANDPFGISTYSGNIFTNDASDYQSGATISDVSGETPDSYGYVFVSSAYGFLQLNVSTGDFSYDLDNSAAAVDALNDGETLLDSFTVNFTSPRVTSSDINVTINGVTDTQAMGETGIIDVSNGSASVTLNGTYVNPVVFASSTQNESDPVAVRIDNLSSTGFDIILAEPSNTDGVHATEQVHYYVFEAGVWQLEDGSIVEVGTTQSTNLHNNSRESIGFEHAFASSDLTVLTHLQTNNNSGWYHTRHGNSTQSGVEFLIQTEEADGSSSLPEIEVVGYLAMESGSGTWSAGTLFEAIQTPNSVKHGWYQVNYAQSFSTTPAVVSTLSTFDGMDDSNTRIRNTSSTGVQVRVAEDTTKDTETNHTTERVDLLAIEAGVQLNGVKIEAEALDIGETGTVSFQNSTSVTITRAFTAPVVFAAVSNNGADPVVVRVDNLAVDSVAGTTTFDLLLAETSNSDGVTAVETVNYMVMEAGTWRLEDGTQVVVGTHNTATTTLKSNKVFDTISTPSMNSPVVMTQLQTNNNSGWVSTRVRNKAATSFQVALEPEEGNQVVFPNAESIGYMVIEAGGGTWDGMDYFAASTPDQVTQNNYAIDLGGLNAADAYFVGSLSKYDGADPSRIRFSNDLTNILVTVEEDTTSDSEVGHTTEAIDYFLFTGVQTLTGFAAE